MTRFLHVALFVLLSLGCQSQADPDQWITTLPAPWTLSESEMSDILAQFQQRYPDFHGRLRAFAIWRVGTPYEIFQLGEEVEPDPDPILRYDVSDCTGHNLTSLAAAHSANWAETRARMIDIHYKPDAAGHRTPSYQSRWHYTLDRITANPYTVDITSELLPASRLKPVEITLNRKEDGSEFLELGWERTITTAYIPNDEINEELLSKLPRICGVCFVKPSYFKLGIVMGHEGMIIDGKEIIHASQSAGETVRLNFLDYYFPEEGPFFDGIMIYEFRQLDLQEGKAP